ncbi:MAG TPA: glycosyltransferase N-terminal domain-containing protein [Chitinivibrionales bacterium]|nr:glycosyltransferase N-terminal domain-containing protein [Chitinivibrionales bacterium]
MTHPLLRLIVYTYSMIMESARLMALFLLRPTPLWHKWDIASRAAIPLPRPGRASSSAVWIHAASLGECKLLARFLAMLRNRHPGQKYVLTAATRTGVDYLRQCGGDDIIAAGFLPLDTLHLMKSLLSTFSVSRVWLMETELWPAMLLACRDRRVPVGLANARIEEDSLAWYRRFAWLLSPLLRYPDAVLAQNEAYAARFARLGVAPAAIRVTGNLKSYVAIRPTPREERTRLRGDMGISSQETCITAGCLHAGEGAVVKDALDALKRRGISARCIVVPRHLKDGAALARELGNGTLRLHDMSAPHGWDVCIVEKMGVLEAMYKIADAAIVGGTFDTTGGHNMWDAAQFGIPLFFGSNYRTQQESGDTLLGAGVAFCAGNGRELAGLIAQALRGKEKFQKAQAAFSAAINGKSHSIEDLIP